MNCLEMEEIDNTLEKTKMLQRHGFMNIEHYETTKENTVNGLVEFGNNFSVALGKALDWADVTDSLKILRYWEQLCEQHKLLWQMKLAKEQSVKEYNSENGYYP